MSPHFSGSTYDPSLDHDRLESQLQRVKSYMSDARWHTLSDIQAACGGSEAAVSARLRDLRKPRFGAFIVERRRTGHPKSGLFEYRMQAPTGDREPEQLDFGIEMQGSRPPPWD